MSHRNLADLVSEIAPRKTGRTFSPCAFYNSEGDTLEVYLSGEDYVAQRVDGFLSWFLAPDKNAEVRGFALKNLKQNLKDAHVNWPADRVLRGAFLLSLAMYLWERTLTESRRREAPEQQTRESLLELYREHADEKIKFRNPEALAGR